MRQYLVGTPLKREQFGLNGYIDARIISPALTPMPAAFGSLSRWVILFFILKNFYYDQQSLPGLLQKFGYAGTTRFFSGMVSTCFATLGQ